MSLEFKRRLRDCKHNKSIQESGETRGLIYDYDVIDNEEKAATFKRWRAEYELFDLGNKPIKELKGASWSSRLITAKSKGEFERVYTEAKAAGRIPTADQVTLRDQAYQRQCDEEERSEKESIRINRIRLAGPDLLEALILLTLDDEGKEWNDSNMSDNEWDRRREIGRQKARAAIAKANGVTDADNHS